MDFLGFARLGGDAVVRIGLAGELRGPDVVALQRVIFEAIVRDWADELVVDLDGLEFLGADGHWVLVSGYVVAVEYGTAYRVVNARGQVLARLQADQTFDMLADSRDLGALLVALLSLQVSGLA